MDNNILLVLNNLPKFKQFVKDNNIDDLSTIVIDGAKLLSHASGQGSPDVIDYIINNGCKTTDVSARGYTILHEACAFGRLDNIFVILEHDKSLLLKENYNGKTILHEACKYNNENVLKYLHREYPNEIKKLNKKDHHGKFPHEYISDVNVKNVAYFIGLH